MNELPVQVVSRSALRSTEIAGVTVAAGSFVLMLLGAANRDPVLCADPDQFSVRRGLEHWWLERADAARPPAPR